MNSTTNSTSSPTLSWPLKILFFIAGQIGSLILLLPFIWIFGDTSNSCIAYITTALISDTVATVLTRIQANERINYAFVLPCLLNAYSLMLAGCQLGGKNFHITLFIILTLTVANLLLIKIPYFRKLHILAIVALVPCILCPKDEDKAFIIISVFQVIYMGILFCLALYEEAISRTFKKVTQYLSAIRFSLAATIIAMSIAIEKIGSASVVLSIIYASGSAALSCVLVYKFVHQEQKIIGSVLLALLCSAATAVSPYISLSLLGFLLSYMVLHYAGMLLYGAFFLWAITNYYYNMDLSLAYKSYLLMGSGIALLLLFYYLKRISK